MTCIFFKTTVCKSLVSVCSIPSLSEQLQEVRSQAEVCLYSGGRVVDVRARVMAMTLASLQRLSTALNILEKYGCNLTNPNRPKYWRTVKHNNPVFRATVDAIQGGRAVLCLYGYSNQQPDGLSFPDDATDPDVGRVAAVTLEVMSLRLELEMLIKVCQIIPTLRHKVQSITSLCLCYSDVINCSVCGIFRMSAHCLTCLQGFCSECDRLYHSSPERANHHRTAFTSSSSSSSSSSSRNRSCNRSGQTYLVSSSTWCCLHCTKVNSIQNVQCKECERPRSMLSPNYTPRPLMCIYRGGLHPGHRSLSFFSEWQCKSCTLVNAASSILCEVCERPRLATKPPTTPSHSPVCWWVCQFCTYLNYSPATACDMCDLARPEPAPLPVKFRPPSPVRRVPALPIKPKGPTPEDLDFWRQKLMKEEGLKLIEMIRDGEKKGVSPEEVYTSLRVAGDSGTLPGKWFKTELPLLLDQIRMLVATHTARRDGGVSQVKELCALGFSDKSRCHDMLRQSGGDVRGALVLLQRPLLQPFHSQIWSEEPEPPVDIYHPDKQSICRRLLAVYDLPSWGRCELALSLLLEHSAPYSLEDVVQAVRESHDREFIKRVLAKECPICLSVFPHSKVKTELDHRTTLP
uniref:RanBP2-type domain-containing protein n=1 Tax=Cynoglossus semilaevis TaxID=244447 RepID=A0A3P8WZY2_CYNSE